MSRLARKGRIHSPIFNFGRANEFAPTAGLCKQGDVGRRGVFGYRGFGLYDDAVVVRLR